MGVKIKKKSSKKVEQKMVEKKSGKKKLGKKKSLTKSGGEKYNIAVLTLLLFSIIKPDVPKNHLQKDFQTSYRQRQRTEHIYRI